MRKDIKAAKQIATILKRTLSVRDYPIASDSHKTPMQMSERTWEYGHTSGFNHGLSLALAILVVGMDNE